MTNSLSKILITGANGQLAQAICHHDKAQQFKLIALNKDELNICDTANIERVLSEHQPEIIINTAAYTAVDKAENESTKACQINSLGPEMLAKACSKANTRLIHISTDYVFDGNLEDGYNETDETNPINQYGKTKLQGEQTCLANCENTIILRVSGVFSEYGHNFVKTMLRLATEKEALKIVDDQFTSPSYAGDIASVLFELCQRTDLRGVYHFCNSNRISWFAFADMVINQARERGFPIKVKQIRACTTADYPTAASRPKYSILNCNKIASDLNFKIPDIQPGLLNTLTKVQEEYND